MDYSTFKTILCLWRPALEMRQEQTTPEGLIRHRLYSCPSRDSQQAWTSRILSHSAHPSRSLLVALTRQGYRMVPQNMSSMSNQICRQGRHTTCRSHTCAPLPQSPHRHNAHAQVPQILIHHTGPLLTLCMARVSHATHRNCSHPWCLHIQGNIMPMGRT